MKLAEFLHEKRWTAAVFSREYNIDDNLIRKILREEGSINLDTALKIEAATRGKVKVWDLSTRAKEIKELFWPEKSKSWKNDSAQVQDEQNNEGKCKAQNVA